MGLLVSLIYGPVSPQHFSAPRLPITPPHVPHSIQLQPTASATSVPAALLHLLPLSVPASPRRLPNPLPPPPRHFTLSKVAHTTVEDQVEGVGGSGPTALPRVLSHA